MKIVISELADGGDTIVVPENGVPRFRVFRTHFNQDETDFVCAIVLGDEPDNIDLSFPIPLKDWDNVMNLGFDVNMKKHPELAKEIVDALVADGKAEVVEE